MLRLMPRCDSCIYLRLYVPRLQLVQCYLAQAMNPAEEWKWYVVRVCDRQWVTCSWSVYVEKTSWLSTIITVQIVGEILIRWLLAFFLFSKSLLCSTSCCLCHLAWMRNDEIASGSSTTDHFETYVWIALPYRITWKDNFDVCLTAKCHSNPRGDPITNTKRMRRS